MRHSRFRVRGGGHSAVGHSARYFSACVFNACAALALLSPPALAQDPPKEPARPEAAEIMTKALEVYSNAKSYQGSWSFTHELGAKKQEMSIEIKSKAGNKMFYRLAPVGKQPAGETIPELQVVIDGKTAWFYNVTSGDYYKVELPKNAKLNPLMMAMPQIKAAGEVTRTDKLSSEGPAVAVLEAPTSDGGKARMEIEAKSYHILRVSLEQMIGPLRDATTLAVQKQVFDEDVKDDAFRFRPGRNAKERPAPPEAAAMFGPAGG